jgi:hypothetical protein
MCLLYPDEEPMTTNLSGRQLLPWKQVSANNNLEKIWTRKSGFPA